MFEPSALASRRPLDPEPWLCETVADGVLYSGRRGRAVRRFALGLFEVDGRLPLPSVRTCTRIPRASRPQTNAIEA